MKHLALACALAACGPRNEPQGPGTMPEPVEGTVAGSSPARTTAPPPAPLPIVAEPAEPVAPPPPAAPTHAKIVFAPAKGSTVKGELAVVQGDDDTRIVGQLTGLAKSGSYTLGKRDACVAHKADDDSRRSKALVYGLTFKATKDGTATLSDTSTAIHLDGPLSLMGAIFVVSKTTGSGELACGRVVAD